MYTVELLEQALAAVKKLGYRVRREPLDGVTGGPCVLNGKRWLFLDAAQGPMEHLHQAVELLRSLPAADCLPLSPELARLVSPRSATSGRLAG